MVAVLNVEWLVPEIQGVIVNLKGKYVYDRDNRRLTNGTDSSGRAIPYPNDDYEGTQVLAFAQVGWQATNELKVSLGYEFSRWLEKNRTGTFEAGYYNDFTTRNTARLGATYAFGGVLIGYTLEYFHKTLDRGRPGAYDMQWNVWRSKGTVEVAF